MGLLLRVAVAASMLGLIGCSESGHEEPSDTPSPIANTAPGGELACGYLGRRSIVRVLGTDRFQILHEHVSRDPDGKLSSAGCQVRLDDDQERIVVNVSVGYLLGYAGQGFRKDLSDDEKNQLPTKQGLGFSWTERPGDPDDPTRGRAELSRGDYLVESEVLGVVTGRDPETDARALAQQAVRALRISDEWTLDGAPPSR